MTTTPTRSPAERRPRIVHTRPPRYLWVPIAAAVTVALGLVWGAVMFYIASH